MKRHPFDTVAEILESQSEPCMLQFTGVRFFPPPEEALVRTTMKGGGSVC